MTDRSNGRRHRWGEAWGIAAIGVVFVIVALIGDYRPEVCAIIGVGLLMQPLLEIAMVRHVRYFVERASMVSDSFDAVWRSLNDRMTSLEKWRREEIDPAASQLRERNIIER